MWFKNLIVFQIEQEFDLNDESLSECLERGQFKSCGSQEPSSLGWVPPMSEMSEQLFHTGSGMYLLTAKHEERVLPVGVIKDAVDDKVSEIEKREERKLGRKQKMEIKEDMIFSMMPRAFTRSSCIQGLILPQLNMIVVDSANRNKAEAWVRLLRHSLGSLAVKPVQTKKSISGLFTGWLNGKIHMPGFIEPGDECELQSSSETRSVVICRRQDLLSDEIKTHLKNGKLVTRMAIEWKQTLSFVLNEAAEIKRFRFSDSMIEQAAQDGAADKAAEFDACFTMMALELSRFLPALWEALGSLDDS